MKIWIFAGGGETEIGGFMPLLRKHFPKCMFEAKFPVGYKPGGKPRKKRVERKGSSGTRSHRDYMRRRLRESLQFDGACDLIILFDDLDCHDIQRQIDVMRDEIIDAVDGTEQIPHIIGFAKPEMESWIVADWDQTMGKYPEFKSVAVEVKIWLKNNVQLDFQNPEQFGVYDVERECCEPKLSKSIQDSVAHHGLYYSKGTDSPQLVQMLDPATVARKCPVFRMFWNELGDFVSN